MKKIYFSSWVMLLLLVFGETQAQNLCAATPPVVKNYTFFSNGQQVCAVYVERMLPNAAVTLFGANLTVIPTASGIGVSTDGTGFASYVYPCNQVPLRISSCTSQGCCTALVPAAASLPVRLTAFNAKLNGDNSIRLDWTTAAELNSNKYIIERSADGKNYVSIGELAAAGNSARPLSYQFVDKSTAGQQFFYRLKQVDIDERFEYSKVIYINNGKGNHAVASVFPNPFRNEIQLVGISSADINQKNVQLFNAAGQQIAFRQSGANAITVSDAAPTGLYFLKVNGQSFKLVKH